jgi:dipeptidyl aminopeptidase/acylaminoacyl peptidase
LKIKKTATGEEIQVTGLPSPAKMSGFTFSLDERYLAFTHTEAKGISLWVVDLSTHTAKALTGPILNQVLGNSMAWLADNSLLIKAVNPARGKVPSAPVAPAGPTIQETSGKAAPSRTYQDLLANPHDEALFAYFMDSQLMRITLDGSSTAVGKPAMIKSMLLSPDKNYLLVESIQKPFSYLVPADRFPYTVEIWSSQGATLKTLAQLPLDEVRPTGFDATVSGIRNVNWRADAPATLYWAEAQDKGDPKIKVAERDIVFTLMAPFTGEKQKLVGTTLRFGGISWSDENFALLSERWSASRTEKVSVFQPGAPSQAPRTIIERSSDDLYNDPGSPLLTDNAYGRKVLQRNGEVVFMTSEGGSPEGSMPFLSTFNTSTKEQKSCGAPKHPTTNE